MHYSSLGETDLRVSRLGFGTGPLGEFFGPLDEAAAISLVHEALDAGITFFDTAAYYGSAEERLGRALAGRRDDVVVGTKTGRYTADDFDYSPMRIRRSVEHSLRMLRTDHVDYLLLHDIEFVPLTPLFEDSVAELKAMRTEGLARYIGVSGYPAATMTTAIQQTDIDICLTYAHATLLDDTLEREIAPVARARGVGLINASAVTLGLLTPAGSRITNASTTVIREAAAKMVGLCQQRGVDIAFIANQYALQQSGCASTLVGTGKSAHLRSAVRAVDAPLDEELLASLLALRPPVSDRAWVSGLPANNAQPTTDRPSDDHQAIKAGRS